MKVRTAELSDAALDWAVAVINYKLVHGVGYITCIPPGKGWVGRDEHRYSTDWAQGGPIIDRERIGPVWNNLWNQWVVPDPKNAALGILGQTFLIAAMRCFVTSRLGDEIEVPDELMACSNRDADASEDQAAAHRPRSR